MPRFSTEQFGAGDQSWLGSFHGVTEARTVTLDRDSFPAADYPGGYVLSGTPLTVAEGGTATPAEAGGDVSGFLLTDQSLAGTGDIPAPMFWHGSVRLDRLPVTLAASDLPALIAAK